VTVLVTVAFWVLVVVSVVALIHYPPAAQPQPAPGSVTTSHSPAAPAASSWQPGDHRDLHHRFGDLGPPGAPATALGVAGYEGSTVIVGLNGRD